jgi:hypothetical protein
MTQKAISIQIKIQKPGGANSFGLRLPSLGTAAEISFRVSYMVCVLAGRGHDLWQVAGGVTSHSHFLNVILLPLCHFTDNLENVRRCRRAQ